MDVQPTATLPGIFRTSLSMYLVLFGIPSPGIALYQVWDGAGLDEQLDLAHKPESGILLRITRTVVIQLTDTAEFLDDDTVNLTLAVGRADGMCPYLVFFSCKVPELACNDGLPDKAGQLLLVIDILVLLLNAEHGGFPQTVQARKSTCPLKAGNGSP